MAHKIAKIEESQIKDVLKLKTFSIINLGVFTVKHFPERKLKHAKLGHIITLPARNVLKFTQDKAIKKIINQNG